MKNKPASITLALGLSISCASFAAAANSTYEFERGFPTSDTARRAYDDIDLNRAIAAYRFFYATVSGSAIFKGNAKVGNRSEQGIRHAGHPAKARRVHAQLRHPICASSP